MGRRPNASERPPTTGAKKNRIAAYAKKSHPP